MKLKMILPFAALLVIPLSCDDILEVSPQDRVDLDVLYESPADAEAGLIGVYHTLFRQFIQDMIYNANLSANELYDAQRGAANRPVNYRPALRVDNDGGVAASWRTAYETIQRANFLIEKVDQMESAKFPDGSGSGFSRKEEIIGEAAFIRAYLYYLLTMNWGDVPLQLTFPSSSDPGANNVARTERATVMAAIVDDLELAEEYLPWNHENVREFAVDETLGPLVNSKGRATKAAAKMMLARLYLADQNWSAAEAKIREIIAADEFSLVTDWVSIFNNTGGQNTAESIWEVQAEFGAFNNTGGYFFRVESSSRTSATPAVYNLFEGNTSDPRDIRQGFSMTPSATNPSQFITPVKYYNRGGGYSTSDPFNFVIFRLADAYLMLAESLNEQAYGSEEALEIVNQIRTRTSGTFGGVTYSGVAPVTYADYPTQAAFREFIRAERQRELLFEGHTWYDLLRYDSYDGGSRAVSSTSLDLQVDGADPAKVLWPIPDREIRVNPLMQQNPGY